MRVLLLKHLAMVAFRIISLLKTYGWLVNLVFIAAGSYFVAGAANTVIAQSIRVVPSADDVKSSGARRRNTQRAGVVNFTRITERNLFGAKKDPPPEPVEPGEEDPTVIGKKLGPYTENDLKKCSIPATLRATLVADNNPQWSLAVLYSNSSREPEVHSLNEGQNQISDDAKLIEIRSRAIVVERSDHYELCSADDEEKKTLTSTRTPRPTVARDNGKDEDGQVRKTGDNEYEVDKEYIDSTMGNLSQVATQARIVPSFKNGKSNGFKLFSIKPGSIYQKIGLQNGDVIQKINGYTIDSPDKALEVYSKLKTSRNVNIDLLRRGRAMSKNYSIR
ncbi:MAG: type II secretion system protein GspC [Myxococcota bacterium]